MTAEAQQEEAVKPIDFDHTSPAHALAWRETYRQLRAECPHARSSNHGGYWVATRYKDVMSAAQCPALSAEKVYNPETGELRGGNIIPPFPVQPVFPIEASPDAWRGYRSFLNRRFSHASAEARRPVARSVARTLVDRFVATGAADLVDDLTSPLPAIVTMEMFGFSLENWIDFAEPIHKYMYYRPDHPEYPEIVHKLTLIIQRLAEEADDRRANPRDDLMSYIANGEIEGRPLTDDEISKISLNLIFGGVDTTTALTSNVLHWLGLAENAAARQRLIDDPALRPIAREEFVRYFSPVHGVARHAVADADVNGWSIKEGESIFLAIASANHDEEIFPDADQVRLDRHPNRHVGFGAGMHHCLGLFIARMMFDAMLDEVLARIPDYRVVVGSEERYSSVDKVNGWAHLPVTFTPGPVLGGGMAL